MKILYMILRIKIQLLNPPATQCTSYAVTKLIEHHIIFIQANSFNPSCLTLTTFQKPLRLVLLQLTVCVIISNQLVVLSLFYAHVPEFMFRNVTRGFLNNGGTRK